MKRKRGDKEARKHKKKRRSGKEEGGSAADGLKLLKYAALGEARKVEKVAKRRRSDIDAIDADGSTALHQVPACHLQVCEHLLPRPRVCNTSLTTVLSQASRHGHLQVVEVLLRCGVVLNNAEATLGAPLFRRRAAGGARAGTAQMQGLRTCEATLQRTLRPPRATLPS